MRQGQQNRRGRGRNNNRKGGHNPLARSFESNGPDVKIRGTPAHIAEKYLTLARDAQTSGDPVLAENYLQHAEHYTRIIMAYREQLQAFFAPVKDQLCKDCQSRYDRNPMRILDCKIDQKHGVGAPALLEFVGSTVVGVLMGAS